jgi:PAS domain S-box-containing protein/putative nucleotidyltransferase with HDIG domain
MDKRKKSLHTENARSTKESPQQANELNIQKGREILRKLNPATFIENTPNGFALHEIILDKDGKPCDYRFLYVNSAFEKLTGLKKENVIGKTALEVLPGLEKYWIDTYGKVAMTGEPVQFEQYSQPLNKYYLVNAFSLKKGYFITIFSDITNIKRNEEEILRLLKFQNTVRTINQLLLKANSEKNLFKKICDIVVKSSIAKFAWIGLIEEGSFDVKPVASAGPYEDYLSKFKFKWDDSPLGKGPTGTAIKTGKPFVIDNIEIDKRFLPWREEALKRNVRSAVAVPLKHGNTIIGAITLYLDKEKAFGKKEIGFLKEVAGDIVVGVNSIKMEQSIIQKNKQLERALADILTVMSRMGEAKDPYTAGHQKRVSQLSAAIARKMGLLEDQIESIRFVSLIHDIGKISIPSELLSKPTKLTETEFALIKDHPKIGYEILKGTSFPWDIASIILQHHERLDGSGYPQGLKNDEILLEAKIIGVADVVEAMSSYRPYRPALGIDKALEEISINKGKLYDPEVVDACIKLFKEDGFKFK